MATDVFGLMNELDNSQEQSNLASALGASLLKSNINNVPLQYTNPWTTFTTNLVKNLMGGALAGYGDYENKQYESNAANILAQATKPGADLSSIQAPDGMDDSDFQKLLGVSKILQNEKAQSLQDAYNQAQAESKGKIAGELAALSGNGSSSSSASSGSSSSSGAFPVGTAAGGGSLMSDGSIVSSSPSDDASKALRNKLLGIRNTYSDSFKQQLGLPPDATDSDVEGAMKMKQFDLEQKKSDLALEKPLPKGPNDELNTLSTLDQLTKGMLPDILKVEQIAKDHPNLTLSQILAGNYLPGTDVARVQSGIKELLPLVQQANATGSGRMPRTEYGAFEGALSGAVPFYQGLVSKRLTDLINAKAQGLKREVDTGYNFGQTASAANKFLTDNNDILSGINPQDYSAAAAPSIPDGFKPTNNTVGGKTVYSDGTHFITVD